MKNNIICVNTCLIGSYASGKTTLINKYINIDYDSKPQPTIGMSSMEKYIKFENNTIRNIIFDTAGQERYSSLIPVYLRDCNILICTIDTKNCKESIEYFDKLLATINYLPFKFICICFTKCENYSNVIDINDINDILLKYNKPFKVFYTSSIENKNIKESFEYFLKEFIIQKQISDFDQIVDITEKEKKCCNIL